MSLNKGEWSEVYVFLKLLAEGFMYAADRNLDKIPDKYYFILKIIKDDINRRFERKGQEEILILNGKEEILGTVNIERFYDQSIRLLNDILNNKGVFNSKDTVEFMSRLGITNLKSKSTDKQDIVIKFHDAAFNIQTTLGFSIKSNLGALPTLFNPSQASNFIFTIEGSLRVCL